MNLASRFALLFVVFFSSVAAFAQTECLAVLRSNDGKREEVKAIPQTFESEHFRKWETDIGLISFSVTFDKENEDYLLLITKGPNYMDGSALRGAFPKSGVLRASMVSPLETYQILCRRN